MFNFRSKFLVLLLVIILLVPAVYCFSLFGPSKGSEVNVNEGQNDTSRSNSTSITSPIMTNDTTDDFSIDNNDTSKDSTAGGDHISEDSKTDGDDSTENPITDDDSKSTNETNTAISWPIIMIMEDNSERINVKSESDSRRVDSSNNWLVINKRTSIRRVEENSRNFGNHRRVLNEDKSEELRIYRDNFHTVVRSGVDLTNILRF